MKLKPFLGLFLLFLVSGSSWAASFSIRCEMIFHADYRQATADFKTTFQNLVELQKTKLKNKGAIEYRIQKLARLAGEILDHQGTKWHYSRDSRNILIIDADPQGSPLNQIATGVERSLGRLRFAFDPRALIEAEAAFFDPAQNRIVFDMNMILQGRMNSVLLHEIRHAYHDVRFLRGDYNEWYGHMDSLSPKLKFNKLYTDYISLDEALTYATELNLHIEELRSNLSQLTSEDWKLAREAANFGRSNVGWISRNAGFAISRLRDPQAGDSFSVSSDQERLAGRLRNITSITVQHGKTSTTLYSRDPKNRRTEAEWKEWTLTRLQGLQSKSEQMVNPFTQLVLSIERRDLDQARELTRSLRSMAARGLQDPALAP